MIIGNKCDDLENREVSSESIRKFEKDHGVKIFETSAKTAANVTEAFISMTKELMNRENLDRGEAPASSVGLMNGKKGKMKHSHSF